MKINLKYSFWIDTGVPVICCKKILRKIEDHMTDLSSKLIKYTDDRLASPLYRPRHCNFGPKSISPSQLSCHTFAIYNLVYQIIDMLVIDTVSDRFSLMNDIGLSFGMLHSVEEIYQRVSQEHLPINSTIQGSKSGRKNYFMT